MPNYASEINAKHLLVLHFARYAPEIIGGATIFKIFKGKIHVKFPSIIC